MSKWIRKGDKVTVIAGNDKGRTGTVLRIQEERVIVEGINIRKKHMKKTAQGGKSQIIEREVPIHISNVSHADDAGKPVKLKVRTNTNGVKELYYLKGQQEVFVRAVKKTS